MMMPLMTFATGTGDDSSITTSVRKEAKAVVPPDSVQQMFRYQLQGGPGIAISGSTNVELLPEDARKFIKKYYGGLTVESCYEDFIKETYHVTMGDETTITFDKKGHVSDITSGFDTSLPEDVIRAILPKRAANHLVQAGYINEVRYIKNVSGKGFGVALLNDNPPHMIFDVDGVFIIVAQ